MRPQDSKKSGRRNEKTAERLVFFTGKGKKKKTRLGRKTKKQFLWASKGG